MVPTCVQVAVSARYRARATTKWGGKRAASLQKLFFYFAGYDDSLFSPIDTHKVQFLIVRSACFPGPPCRRDPMFWLDDRKKARNREEVDLTLSTRSRRISDD